MTDHQEQIFVLVLMLSIFWCVINWGIQGFLCDKKWYQKYFFAHMMLYAVPLILCFIVAFIATIILLIKII